MSFDIIIVNESRRRRRSPRVLHNTSSTTDESVRKTESKNPPLNPVGGGRRGAELNCCSFLCPRVYFQFVGREGTGRRRRRRKREKKNVSLKNKKILTGTLPDEPQRIPQLFLAGRRRAHDFSVSSPLTSSLVHFFSFQGFKARDSLPPAHHRAPFDRPQTPETSRPVSRRRNPHRNTLISRADSFNQLGCCPCTGSRTFYFSRCCWTAVQRPIADGY